MRLKGILQSVGGSHHLLIHIYNILLACNNCEVSIILNHRISDVNRLRHWRIHVRTSYVCPTVYDVSSTSRFAYVTIIIVPRASARLCLFQQSASDVNDLASLVLCLKIAAL